MKHDQASYFSWFPHLTALERLRHQVGRKSLFLCENMEPLDLVVVVGQVATVELLTRRGTSFGSYEVLVWQIMGMFRTLYTINSSNTTQSIWR